MNRSHWRYLVGLPLVCGLGSAAPTAADVGPSLTMIGTFSGFGSSRAYAVSPDGQFVAGNATTVNGRRAFLWSSEGGLVNLGTLPGGTESFAYGVSAGGSSVVGVVNSGGGQRAFHWTAASGLGELTAGGSGAQAHAISADGTTTAGWSMGPFVATRWDTSGAPTPYASLTGGGSTLIRAVTPDGAAAAGYVVGNSAGTQAARWLPDGSAQLLGLLPGTDRSYGFGISADASVVVGYCWGESWQAFRWTEDEGMTLVGMLPGASGSVGSAVSADGRLIGGFADFAGERRAFLESDEFGLVNLNDWLPTLGIDLSGWILSEVNAISHDGSALVGYGYYQGMERAWVVQSIPAPGAGLLAIVAALSAVLRRARIAP